MQIPPPRLNVADFPRAVRPRTPRPEIRAQPGVYNQPGVHDQHGVPEQVGVPAQPGARDQREIRAQPGVHAQRTSAPTGKHAEIASAAHSERSPASRFMHIAFDSSLGNDIASLSDDYSPADDQLIVEDNFSRERERAAEGKARSDAIFPKNNRRWAYAPRSLIALIVILLGMICILAIVCAIYARGNSAPLASNADTSSALESETSADAGQSHETVKNNDQAAHKDPASIVVYVSGAVLHSGIFTLDADSRVADAIEAAGGLKDNAQQVSINLAAKLSDGQHVHVFAQGESLVDVAGAENGSGSSGASSTNKDSADNQQGGRGEKINLNSATEEQLETLPHIGPVTAQKILQWRSDNGGFTSIDQLKEVPGIGEKTFSQMKSYVRVD